MASTVIETARDVNLLMRSNPDRFRHKAVLVSEAGRKYVMPFAPREVDFDGITRAWEQVPRPGRKPILEERGKTLKTLSFTFVVGRRDGRPIENHLDLIKGFGWSGDRVYWRYGRQERGWYRVTTLNFSSIYRAPRTHLITRATVAMTLTEASDAVLNLGPVTGGKKGGGKKREKDGGGGKKATETYIVKAGDTLSGIAASRLGDASRWREIADLNDVKDPRLLQIGVKLKLPS